MKTIEFNQFQNIDNYFFTVNNQYNKKELVGTIITIGLPNDTVTEVEDILNINKTKYKITKIIESHPMVNKKKSHTFQRVSCIEE